MWILDEDTQALRQKSKKLHEAFSTLADAIRAGRTPEEYEPLLKDVLRGKIPGMIAHLPHVKDIADNFADFATTNRLIDRIAQTPPDQLEQVFYDLEAERALRKQLQAKPLPDFDRMLAQEAAQMEWQVKSLTAMMHREGYTDFNGVRLYKEHGLAHSRVMCNAPIIMPHPFYKTGLDGGGNPDKPGYNRPWQINAYQNSTIGGLGFGFGFVELETTAKKPYGPSDDLKRSIIMPAVALDRNVFHSLDGMRKTGGASEALANKIFAGLQEFCTIGSHDYVHHMIFSAMENKSPKFRPRRQFTRQEAPMHDGEISPILKYGFLQGKRLPTEALILQPLEKFSCLLHRDTWDHIFKAYPAVKEEMLCSAVAFLGNLAKYKAHVAATEGQDKADQYTAYIATIALGQLHMALPIEDPDLQKPVSAGGDAPRSVRDAVNALQLPPYKGAAEWLRKLKLTDTHGVLSGDPDYLKWMVMKKASLEGKLTDSAILDDASAPIPDVFAYAFRKLRAWKQESGKSIEELHIGGYDGMMARIIIEGARGAGWMNDYEINNDAKLPSCPSAAVFCRAFFDPVVQRKPAIRQAVNNHHEVTAVPPQPLPGHLDRYRRHTSEEQLKF